MAITWGTIVGNNNGRFRLGYEVSYSGNTTYVHIYIFTQWTVTDNVNSFIVNISGGTGYNGNVPILTTSNRGEGWNETYNKKLLGTLQTNNLNYSFSASLSGLEACGISNVATISGSGVNPQHTSNIPIAPDPIPEGSTYTPVSTPKVSYIDNGDNNVTIIVNDLYAGSNNNIVSGSFLYNFDGSSTGRMYYWEASQISNGAIFFTTSIPTGSTGLWIWDVINKGDKGEVKGNTLSNVPVKYFSICTPPSTIILSPDIFENEINLNFSGATPGYNNNIVGYLLQYSISKNNIIWGEWIEFKSINTSNTEYSETISDENILNLLSTKYYIRFRILTIGSSNIYKNSYFGYSNSIKKSSMDSVAATFENGVMNDKIPHIYRNGKWIQVEFTSYSKFEKLHDGNGEEVLDKDGNNIWTVESINSHNAQ